MATNLCAECGARLPRSEYKAHMEQVHGVSVHADSDTEAPNKMPEGGETAPAEAPAGDAPRPQRQRNRRRGPPAAEGAAADAPAGEFACSECDRSFATAQGLSRHAQAKHPGTAAAEAAAAAAAAAPPPPTVRRGGRPRGAGDAPAAEGDAAEGEPKPDARRRPRRPRGQPRGRAPAAARPDDPEAAAAMSAEGGASRGERLVTLFRCKLCDMGFKSKNRARAHVTETHPGDVPAEAPAPEPAAEGEAAPAGPAVPADALLNEVQISARRTAPRRGRPSNRPAPAPGTVRRGGRPPRGGAGAPSDELAALGITAS